MHNCVTYNYYYKLFINDVFKYYCLINIIMLFAGWEVHIVHFQDQGHSFSLYGPTLSR